MGASLLAVAKAIYYLNSGNLKVGSPRRNFAVFWLTFISRFWVRHTLFLCQCYLTCPWILSNNLINNVQINRNATDYGNSNNTGAPNDNFGKNICSEDDVRSRIFETFVVKFLACLPLLGFSNIQKMVYLPIFNGFLP